MRASLGATLLRLLGALCAAAGLLAWIGVAWTAFSDPDRATPQNGEGGRLTGWALVGTVVTIVGMILLHLAAQRAERGEREPPR